MGKQAAADAAAATPGYLAGDISPVVELGRSREILVRIAQSVTSHNYREYKEPGQSEVLFRLLLRPSDQGLADQVSRPDGHYAPVQGHDEAQATRYRRESASLPPNDIK